MEQTKLEFDKEFLNKEITETIKETFKADFDYRFENFNKCEHKHKCKICFNKTNDIYICIETGEIYCYSCFKKHKTETIKRGLKEYESGE